MFLLLRLSGARVLFMVHDVVPHAWTLGRRLRSLERAAHGLSYTLASELIVLTPALKRALGADFAIPAGKITVIPHGPLELGDLPPPPGAGRLLLFGSLRRNKSVAEVIEAVSLARRDDPQLTLVIAGEPHPSEPGYWEACRAAIARDPAGFDVREGFVADTDLPGLVAGIDAFVLAYRDFESQSGVAVLAALAARPSLCTTSGGLADLIAEGLTHQPIASPVTAPTVAAAIRAFRARPFAAWRDQAEASRRHFAGTLSWQAIGARYLERIRDPGR
jgi:glycosyltransferase involved in cell wall biosynthesis